MDGASGTKRGYVRHKLRTLKLSFRQRDSRIFPVHTTETGKSCLGPMLRYAPHTDRTWGAGGLVRGEEQSGLMVLLGGRV